jgi:copper chaperone
MTQIPITANTAGQPSDAPGADVSDGGELTYVVAEMSCDHCKASVTGELVKVPGVRAVGVDLETKVVRVRGTNLDDGAVRAAIEEAGYAAVAA